MSDYLKYSKSIGKSLSNAASTIKDDGESYLLLESLQQYIGCKGFVYEKQSHENFMRTILLKLWSKLLLMLKTAHFSNQNTIFTFITFIMNRSEFLLENCGFEGSSTSIEPEIKEQLIHYIFLLKLTLLYTPRAVVSHATPAREFVFTTISASIIRIPEYRICFFTQLQGLIRSTSVALDAGVEDPFFQVPTSSFITKYIDPHLLKGEMVEESTSHFSPHFLHDMTHPNPLLSSTHSITTRSSLHSESDLDLPSESVEDPQLDIKTIIANLPPAYSIKNDLIIFHEDSESSYYKKEEDFCYDDHNFDIVSIDDDHSENPYSTMNIQDILRTQRYMNTMGGTFYTDSLPPLRLPNMNAVVDMMYERVVESVEEHLRTKVYIGTHPSLFGWNTICKEEAEESHVMLGESAFRSNDEETEPSGPNLQKEIIGDLYLDTQVISLFGRSKALLSQFITFYMKYIRSLHNTDEVIVWPAIPGYFLLMRLFLINFQEFFMSKLSSGILRINHTMERIIKDSIAYSLCDHFVVDGEVLNHVMTILFDKCNVNVFLDISKCLMTLHNLLKAIRDNNNIIYYHEYSFEFYKRVYGSQEIKLLIQLQNLNKNGISPMAQPTCLTSPTTSLHVDSTHTLSVDATELDLPTLDAMSYTNHYYNNNLSIIYTSTTALDLLYETTIDSTIKNKSTKPVYSQDRYTLHRMPSQWMKNKDTIESVLHEEGVSESIAERDFELNREVSEGGEKQDFESNPEIPSKSIAERDFESNPETLPKNNIQFTHQGTSITPKQPLIEPMEWDSIPPPPPLNPNTQTTVESMKSARKSTTLQNTHYFMKNKVEGFTILQAIQLLLDHDIITSRGEGLDFFSILQDRRIIEPLQYERRFKTTIYRVIPLQSIKLYRYPEISLFNHSYFEDRINYVYFLYVLKGLIRMPHVQIIEKVLSFIYFNEDFFNGKHRLQLYREIIFPNFALFFTHWNANIRHIFHRLLIYKMFRTRLTYLPRYGSLEIENELYNRIFEYRKEMRRQKNSILQEDIVEEENENNVFSYDRESQQRIWNHFNYDAYVKSQTSRSLKQSSNKISTCLQLSAYRETQSVDLKLAEMLKADLHMLMNINQFPNHNKTNGKTFVPSNQLRYFWTSLLEYVTLLGVYERNELKSKPRPIYTDNIYHDGVGCVEDTDIPWILVNEMESRIMDTNNDIEFFLAHKN